MLDPWPWFRPVPELLQAIEEVKASQAQTVRRVLQELREMDNSGVSGWSMEDLVRLRKLQLEEERESKNGIKTLPIDQEQG